MRTSVCAASIVAGVGLGVFFERWRSARAQSRCFVTGGVGSGVSLRRAGPGDAAQMLSFIKGLAEFEMQPQAVCLSEEQLRQDITAGLFECVLADSFVTGECIGFALFYMTYSTTVGRGVYLHDLFVDYSARRQGVGLALLRAVAQVAHARECARLIWCAFDWNENAILFYKSPVVGAQIVSSTLCETPKYMQNSKEVVMQNSKVINFKLDAAGIARIAGYGVVAK
mmetsp:Transcript_9802/g.10897  ORF Transcript_9802/g.10897 Transcript_9802/m.10897 type:complete len:226 (+) Transcript_9802:90-767(+)|eukprot:CAMPEP_0194139058 /NCGR_PEP_ID=MMETSP0152-20130528/8807_1 /TAXON_ID=1049557 /ORGANISM="Thalassiothrix antarctica, Strain L6-D1" /LENGTH=225 /DNA_ID=CAMNT_0038836787 /DNA_START=18 /DNA_END=695 /DNA_ORIENTATION=-